MDVRSECERRRSWERPGPPWMMTSGVREDLRSPKMR